MENREIFRRLYEDAWNPGDVSAVDRFLDKNFVNHSLEDVAGSHREAYKEAITETRTVFPDWTTEIQDLIADGDSVAARWAPSGTHTGALANLQPTGAGVRARGMTIVRIVDGRITNFWKADDSHTVPQQLEAAPKTGR